MSTIRDNLLKIHLAKNVAGLLVNHQDPTISTLAKKLITQCTTAHKAIEWRSININLHTCNRIMRQYSRTAYGRPDKNHIDILQLLGLAITQLEEAISGQTDPAKRQSIETCHATLLQLNHHFDKDMTETDTYIAASTDAQTLATILEET